MAGGNGGLISLSPEEITAVRNGFQKIISEFENNLTQVVNDADNLASTWKGVSYDAFVSLMQQWKADVQKAGVDSLQSICTNMTTSSTSFQTLDADLQTMFSGFGG